MIARILPLPQREARQRPGAIKVPAGCSPPVIEGAGAARRESTRPVDAVIWVQADKRETERRNLAQVGTAGRDVDSPGPSRLDG